MVRYTPLTTGKRATVRDLYNQLNLLIEQGCADELIFAFDGDSGQVEPLTGLTYGEGVVEFYTDEP